MPVDERVRGQLGDDEPPVVVVGDAPLGEPPGEKPPRHGRARSVGSSTTVESHSAVISFVN
ncbi:hypothetical protein [Actinomadura sp. 7K534]|uniref:hypothetical protein n=1 Tax=Actinomadura sp. 7K534 TaxID=2530366 RepID=UPI0010488662|nr:hypothetical protein [Actinomadura sp. 7K534]TDB98657.1 hypothetical protein E1266_02675 [Actinomadura sp. 7K534]